MSQNSSVSLSVVSGAGHVLAFPVVVVLNGMMSHISARNATMFLANIVHKSQKVFKKCQKMAILAKTTPIIVFHHKKSLLE